MADLFLHHQKLESIFELLGTKENGITYSLGWALSQSAGLLKAILLQIFGQHIDTRGATIFLQKRARHNDTDDNLLSDRGITDIEIKGNHVHVIVEAKRGWWLPETGQLERYAGRLKDSPGRARSLTVMSECSAEYAKTVRPLPPDIDGIPVHYLSWKQVADLCRQVKGTHAEKRLVKQLETYLGRLIRMQNQESNMVYVVSVGSDRPSWSSLSWIEFIENRNCYFHPVGIKGWPKEPPNYIGFRYHGQLQSIHHIESYKIVHDLHPDVPEVNAGRPHETLFLYELGKPIKPAHDVKSGKIQHAARVWSMLDLLLICQTLDEAVTLTRERRNGRDEATIGVT